MYWAGFGGANAKNKGATAGVISGNLNLGIKGTPITVVGRSPTAGQVEMIDVLLRLGQALDEQNVPEGPLGRDVGWCRPHDQAVRAAAGLRVG